MENRIADSDRKRGQRFGTFQRHLCERRSKLGKTRDNPPRHSHPAITACALLLLTGSAGFAQEAKPEAKPDPNKLRDALEWTIALRGRMAQMSNPVVRVHGTASVARLVCPLDPVAASGIYQESIKTLFNIPASAFSEKSTTVLPVASFSGLWKYVVPEALKCDPNLASAAQNQNARERLDRERAAANGQIAKAYSMLDNSLDKADMLDRAAQVALGGLEAGDPDTFDMATFSLLLSRLNERAPDLADDLFIRGVDFVMAATVPAPNGLQDLAKFLFTSPKAQDKPEEEQPGSNFKAGGITVEDLTSTRVSANPENIEALIEATLKLLTYPNSVSRNPTVAYALPYQLLPRARDLMPDRVPDFEKAMAQLETDNPGVASRVQAGLGAAQNPDPESGDPAVRNFWLVGQIQSALASGQFDRARQLLTRVDDPPVRGQISALIAFAEAAHAVESKSDQALGMANLLKPGIKRSLLYLAIIATPPHRDTPMQMLPLASKDIEPLPAEQRVRLLSALSAALVRTDVDAALNVFNQLIAAYNDVRANPRRGKFDPVSVRKTFQPEKRCELG